jgi:hypothetical protein
MSRAALSLVLPGLTLALLVPTPAQAQEGAVPPVSYPYFRAYQQFLDSLPGSRTFTLPSPDSPTPNSAPYGYQGPDVKPPPAPAQAYGPPPVSYNYARAYRHFLNSPYSYRTFSSQSPGYATFNDTPYGYQWTVVGPSYTHQRITPHGFEGYTVPPASVTYTVRPAMIVPAYPPGPWMP